MGFLGTLYGISVGPGDPELITLKGLRLLRSAPVVAFPAGKEGGLGLAEQIITPWLAFGQVILPLDFPFRLDRHNLQQVWSKVGEKVWSFLQQGQDVAFICEGDGSFYSTFAYLAQTLQQQHPEVKIEVIPGVSSPLAMASLLGFPLVMGEQHLAILPTLGHLGELEKVLDWADVVVLLKVSSIYGKVWQILAERELLDRCWIVERVMLPEQKIYAGLRDRPTLELDDFSLLIIQNSSS